MTDSFSQASDANRIANLIRLGTISEIRSGKPAMVRVEIEDEWTSDFVPAFQLSAGRVRTWSSPKEGEQVVLLAPSGELTAAVALRGLAYGDFSADEDGELVTVLGQWDDGALETYDEATGARTLTLPDGGQLVVNRGALSATFSEDAIVLTVGSAELKITSSAITLKADTVNLGGEGGQPVARNNDPVAANKVTATSTKVRAV